MKKKGITLATMTTYDQVPPPPPPVGFTSPFKSIQEWLLHLCDTNEVTVPISEFQFGLGKTPTHHLLSVLGFNTHEVGADAISRTIDFKPASHGHFTLPSEEFATLSEAEVKEQVLNELRAFIASGSSRIPFYQREIASGWVILAGFGRKRNHFRFGILDF